MVALSSHLKFCWLSHSNILIYSKNFICYTATVQQVMFRTNLDLRQAWLGLSVQHRNISIYSFIIQNPELEYTHKWSHGIFLVGKKKKNEMEWENTFTKYMPSPFSQPEAFLIQQKLGHDLSWLYGEKIDHDWWADLSWLVNRSIMTGEKIDQELLMAG